MEQIDQITREFQKTQQQIINEIDEPTTADISAEEEFEERVFDKSMVKRVISASRNVSVELPMTESNDLLAQLLQRQMTIMERYEANGASQTRTTSGTTLQEDGNPLGTLLQTQTEILQRLSDSNSDGVIGGNRVKLPMFKLPTFDDKIEEWTKFFDAFTKTIHNNLTLPNIQKFIYLRSCVAGAAARTIEDIELSDDNYAVA